MTFFHSCLSTRQWRKHTLHSRLDRFFFIHVLRIVCPMQMYKRSLTTYDLLLNKEIFIIVYTSSVGTSLLFEILSRSLSLFLSPGFMKCMLFLDVVAKTPENSLYVSIRFLLEYVRRWKKKHMIIYARRDFTNLCARMKYWIIHRLTWLCVRTTCVCFYYTLPLSCLWIFSFFIFYRSTIPYTLRTVPKRWATFLRLPVITASCIRTDNQRRRLRPWHEDDIHICLGKTRVYYLVIFRTSN